MNEAEIALFVAGVLSLGAGVIIGLNIGLFNPIAIGLMVFGGFGILKATWL